MLHGNFQTDDHVITNIGEIPMLGDWCGAMFVQFFEDGIKRFDWTVFRESLSKKQTPYCYCVSQTNESEKPITLKEYLKNKKTHPFLKDFNVKDMDKTSLWEYYEC